MQRWYQCNLIRVLIECFLNLPQDKPESFERTFRGSPSEALQKAQEVLSVYWELVTTSDTPVDWRCKGEYTETFGITTEIFTNIPTNPPTEHVATGGGLCNLESSQAMWFISCLCVKLRLLWNVSSTDRAERNLVKASQMSPERDLYKFGFIVTSICGGLLLMFTIYCLVIQRYS